MVKRARWAVLLALGVSAAAAPLAHCGGDDDDLSRPSKPGGTGTTTQHACKSPKKLTVEKLHPSEERDGVLEGTATGADGTQWTVRLELSDTESSKTSAGRYDLAKENANYDTCQRCVVAFQGDGLVGASKLLFQNSGTMQLATVSSPPTAVSKGTLSKVQLREVTVDGMGAEMTDVKNGGCYEIDTLEWDTLPAPNTKCQVPEDCGDPGSVTCDPVDGTCKAFQCEAETGKGCDEATQVCVVQDLGSNYGACYPRCAMFDSSKGCSADRQCVASDGDQKEGICLTTGTAIEGQPCESTQLTTGCQAGLLCQAIGGEDDATCHRICDYFGTAASCGAGQRCVYGGVCAPETGGDSAALGAPCSDASDEGTPCAGDASGWKGHCVSLTSYPDDGTEPVETLTCVHPCRDEKLDCAAGEVCDIGDSELALPFCRKPEEMM